MKLFNRNAHVESAVYVPAEHYLYVSNVIRTLTENGVPIRDLFVAVRDGELQLGDETGSYGVHRWDR